MLSLLGLGISGIQIWWHILGNVFIQTFSLLSPFHVFNVFLNFYFNVFTALHGMQTRSSDGNSVAPCSAVSLR